MSDTIDFNAPGGESGALQEAFFGGASTDSVDAAGRGSGH